ncbi:Nucleoporin NUP49 [Lasiodiplodia theobromae]|uniref:Nucleoporin NUP49 n=1 Tax=Lasiodiplodia theobromae TaxID=45133 RepID=A0A5N5DCS8_9PEZI|nr:Nucleoporin NUP49 [Lasiodiplodia theobromae]
MSSDIPKQEFLIDDLPTTSVTIYPSRAHVVRDIADVKLQPGLNEVSIYGITPAADEHSVQVDGHGAATITDMSVELVPNRERFVDQFSDEDSSDSDGEDLTDSEFESMYLKGLAEELRNFQDELEEAREEQSCANDQLRVLNAFMESMNAKHNEPAEASKAISAYGNDRTRLYKQWTYAKRDVERLEKAIRKQEAKLQSKAKEERKVKKKQREEKEKKRAQRARERKRVRDEKAKFWPRRLYCVKLTLELPTDTPTSSRRGSVESASQLDEKKALADGTENTVRLSLSYVVREASWSPRYNVSISSTTKTATITYSAEFSNKTSETWRDATVTLSTSQTSYAGLDDKVPELRPWPIFLRDKHTFDEDDHLWDAKFSPQENLAGGDLSTHWPGQDKFNRFEFFGPESSLFGGRPPRAPTASGTAYPSKPAFGIPSQLGPGFSLVNVPGRGFGGNNAGSGANPFSPGSTVNNGSDGPSQHPPATGGGLFGNSTNAQPAQVGGLFGSNSNNAQPAQGGGLFGGNTNAQPAQSGGGLFGSSNNNNNTQPAAASSLFGSNSNAPPPTGGLFGNIGANNSAPQATPFTLGASEPPQHSSLHQEPTWEDSGMTTAYELPGTRTLAPSSLARRHKITTITIRDITLSYIAIPKLRKGAFLRAQLRNPSTTNDENNNNDNDNDSGITLLQGAAGLTLDGSFLGNATLPRTAPGEDLDLDLGVDPAVHVAYAPALLRRGTPQSGLLLGRDTVDRYARCTTITNARKAAVRVTVRDQVPLSEQERLRVEVLEPRGLVRGGGKVRAGVAAAEEEKAGGGKWWGEVTAEMKEGNVVEWTVELEKGKSCKLPLEWEVRMPGDKRTAFS